jgi:hypothetical protein
VTAVHSHRRPSFHQLLVQALAKLWHGGPDATVEADPKPAWPLNLTPPVVDPTPPHFFPGNGSYHAGLHPDPDHQCWWCSDEAILSATHAAWSANAPLEPRWVA